MHHDTASHNTTYILILSITAAITGLLFGFDAGVISGALQFIAKTFHISTTPIGHTGQLPQYLLLGFMHISGITLKEFLVAAVPGGALIGSILSSYFSIKAGRKGSILITALMFIAGTAIAVVSANFNMLFMGRLLMGFAIGLSAMIAPMYLSEVAPPSIRGAIIFLYQMAITVGLLSAFIVNYLFQGAGGWRAMFAVGIIPSVFLFFGMLMLPESPRWLLQHGKNKRAEAVLHKLRGEEKDVHEELNAIKTSVHHAHGGLKVLLSKRMRVLIYITFGLFLFQQCTGINTILYYAPKMFQSAGFVGSSSQILALIATGTVNVLATLLGIWLIDRLGRRKLLMIGMVGMIACLFMIGAVYQHLIGTPAEMKWLTLGAALMFIVFFATSISGIAYIMMAELFPLNVRNVGMAFASTGNWAFNMLVTATFLTLVHVLGIGHCYWLYASLTTIGLVFVFFLVPETKNVSLEQIEENLYNGVKVRHLNRH